MSAPSPTAWRCDLHGVWTDGDCARCDDELIALAEDASCACSPADRSAGRYALACVVHVSWRCVVGGCGRAAVEAHVCLPCGRRAGAR